MTFTTSKDPESVIDYAIDWSATLAQSDPDDTIATSSWAADNGLIVDSDSKTDTIATVWVSAGNRGTIASLVNTITTTGGRTYQRTIHLTMTDK